LPLDAFAESLGLPGAPRVKFLNREISKQRKNASRQTETAIAEAEESQSNSDQDENPKKVAVSVWFYHNDI
jgi:ATP-dependent RNA helicase DDX10/DBP4